MKYLIGVIGLLCWCLVLIYGIIAGGTGEVEYLIKAAGFLLASLLPTSVFASWEKM